MSWISGMVGRVGQVLPIRESRAQHLWDALNAGVAAVGFDKATGGNEVFTQLVLGRLIEPTSKLDTIRVLNEMGFDAASYRTVRRRLQKYAKAEWRRRLAAACAAHVNLDPATLVLYDVSTLKPQITIRLLTDAQGSRCWSKRSRETRPRPAP